MLAWLSVRDTVAERRAFCTKSGLNIYFNQTQTVHFCTIEGLKVDYNCTGTKLKLGRNRQRNFEIIFETFLHWHQHKVHPNSLSSERHKMATAYINWNYFLKRNVSFLLFIPPKRGAWVHRAERAETCHSCPSRFVIHGRPPNMTSALVNINLFPLYRAYFCTRFQCCGDLQVASSYITRSSKQKYVNCVLLRLF